MRSWSILWIVLVLISVQSIPLENNDWNSTGNKYSIEQGVQDVEITAFLPRSTVNATLPQKLNKKDATASITASNYNQVQLPLSKKDSNKEFICVLKIFNLFPQKYQSNNLS